MNLHNTSKNGKLLFVLKPGFKRTYLINEVKEVCNQIGDSTNRTTHAFNTEMNLSYNILPNAEADYNAIVQFDSANLNNKYYVGESITDSLTDSSSKEFLQGVETFKGTVLKVNLGSTGKVKSIIGYENFRNKFDSMYADSSTKTNGQAMAPFKESYFKDIFERITGILPDKAVHINSIWVKQDSIEIGTPLNIQTTYTYNRIQNGIAYIKISSPINQSVTVRNHTMQMEGDEEGEIELDANTGMLIKSEKKLTMHGSVQIGAVNFLMTINRRTTINGILE